MKRLHVLLIAVFFSSMSFSLDVSALSCSVRSGSCGAAEVCLFSLYKPVNSHIADCSTYNYKLCCDFQSSIMKQSTCDPSETGIVSLSKISNSHVEIYGNFRYINNVCVGEVLICNLQASCGPSEACVASFFRDLNSHAAECSYYANKLCCRSSLPYLAKGVVLDYETGLPVSGGVVTGIIKETGETSHSSISTDGSFILRFNTTVDTNKNKFTLSLVINSSDNKMGYAELVAGGGPFTASMQSCSIKLWHFTGRAIDPDTGNYVSSGTVTISVLGTTYTNSTSFSNGIWDIYISPCLVPGESYTFKFIVSYGDKSSSSFVEQIAK